MLKPASRFPAFAGCDHRRVDRGVVGERVSPSGNAQLWTAMAIHPQRALSLDFDEPVSCRRYTNSLEFQDLASQVLMSRSALDRGAVT
jgi:hypothetical protein